MLLLPALLALTISYLQICSVNRILVIQKIFWILLKTKLNKITLMTIINNSNLLEYC